MIIKENHTRSNNRLKLTAALLEIVRPRSSAGALDRLRIGEHKCLISN